MDKPATLKSMSSQVRDPTRGPLKPVNRTTSGPTSSCNTKGGVDSQAPQQRFGYPEQQNVPGYPVPMQGITAPPASVSGFPSNVSGPYVQSAPNMQGIYTSQGQHHQMPNMGHYINPNYQQQMPIHGTGPFVSNGYPVHPLQNPRGQFPLPQQPNQMYGQGQTQVNNVGYYGGFSANQNSVFTQVGPQVQRYEVRAGPMVTHQPPPPPQAVGFQGQPVPVQNFSHQGKNQVPPRNQDQRIVVNTRGGAPSQVTSPKQNQGQSVEQLYAHTSPIHQAGGQLSHSSSAATSPGSVSNTSIGSNSSQVPPEVLQLLQHQDQQLRELKEQLASLLAKQNTPEHSQKTPPPPQTKDLKTTATQMSAGQSPVKPKQIPKETCTIATNTSLWYPRDDVHNHTSNTHNGTAETQDSGRGSHQHETNDSWHTINDFQQQTVGPDEHYSNHIHQEQRMQDWRTNQHGIHHSPPRGHFEPSEQDNSPGRTISDNISLNDLHAAQIPDQCQEESIMSQMIVDMPAYTSMSPDK